MAREPTAPGAGEVTRARRNARDGRPSRAARPKPLPRLALVLSGGNALGAYQAGAYETLDAAGKLPQWLAGTSIGAINAAIIAGNRPEDRVPRLRAFWNEAAGPGYLLATPDRGPGRRVYNLLNAANTFLFGRPGLFAALPPDPLPALADDHGQTGRYDMHPLRATLDRLVDFGRLNSGDVRVTVNATDITTGDEVFFDSARETIEPDHILASAALPFDFPPVEIGGRWLCDGGMSVNVALEALLREPPAEDIVCLVLDLFDARAARPASLDAALKRRHDLPFANQSRKVRQELAREFRLRTIIAELARQLPSGADDAVRALAAEGTEAMVLLIHAVYAPPADELAVKMYDYSPLSVRDRWTAGRDDMVRALEAMSEALAAPRRPGLHVLEVPREEPA